MEYGKIIAVTGMPGLFELLSSKNDGAIVRSLEDKSTKFISSRVHNFSHLESIEVFTIRDNVNLADIFHAMEKEGGKIPDGKDGAALKKYFEKTYPDLDFERVYSSDLKKMAKWFEVLKANNIEIKLSEPAPEEEETVAEAQEAIATEQKKPEQQKTEAPAKKKAKSQSKQKDEIKEEKPKKTPVKKKAEPKAKSASAGKEKDKAPKKAAAKKAPAKKK